ncbi:MAG: hypothetical protein DRI30_08650 [Chloroflexi bacterium]|nr:MAG: hypothetical protein DRI30_08650 [Chloroflexota bacterium]
MKKATLIALLGTFSCTSPVPAVAAGPDPLVGSWRLISAEGHSTDGSITYDWGREPLGRVMFDDGGRMSIHLVHPSRAPVASADFLRPTPEELKESWDGYFGYFGSYSVDEGAGVLTCHVEGAAYPNYIDSDQRRFFILEGDRLTLRTPPERAGDEDITYVIVWEREG